MVFSSMWRRGGVILAGILLVMVTIQVAATSAATASAAGWSAHPGTDRQRGKFPPGYFFIRNVESNLVLEVRAGSIEDGAPVIVWNRTGDASQLWTYDSEFLVNKNSGLCLEVAGMSSGGVIAPGTALVQSARREPPASLNQLWAYNYMYLMPYDPRVVITAEGDNLVPGARAVVDRAVSFPDNIRQQWAFESP